MIKGLGSDLIEIARIKRLIDKEGQKFLDRIFTEGEQAYCLQHSAAERHFAARFAAKEAVAKALGTGIRGVVGWKDIEVVNDDAGKPVVELSISVQMEFSAPSIHLSLTHSKEHAFAVAIWES